jgi:hypothetical protein
MDAAGRVTAGWPAGAQELRRAGARKVRTPKGRTLGRPQAAKADG